jgi:hypothetical protein
MCDCNSNCCCCWSYKPSGKGGCGWPVLWLVLLLSLPFHGWLTLLLIAACWQWLLGALGVWIALRLVGVFVREKAPPPRNMTDAEVAAMIQAERSYYDADA